jgi:hypothetical protein
MLLASAAALALTTGSGLAQGTTQDHGGGAAQSHATQSPAQKSPGGAMKPTGGASNNATSPASKAEKAEGTNERQGGPTMQKGAQRNEQRTNQKAEENRGGNAQNAQNKHNQQEQNGSTPNNRAERSEQNRGTAEQQRSHERNATTQQQRGNNRAAEQQLERSGHLQANASGVNVKLNDQQRNEIRSTVIEKSGAPRVGHVDFDVMVGTVVPRERVHVAPVPETLVQIEPEWRGYRYFVYNDEIVIVNPRDMKIVAVLPV